MIEFKKFLPRISGQVHLLFTQVFHRDPFWDLSYSPSTKTILSLPPKTVMYISMQMTLFYLPLARLLIWPLKIYNLLLKLFRNLLSHMNLF